jgi:general L-amino acid transport system permease protein
MNTMQNPAPQRAPRRKASFKSIAIQVAFVAGIAAILAYFVLNAIAAVQSLGMTTGFGFLERPRAWALPPSMIESGAQDTYARTMAIAAFNTLVVGLAAIAMSTVCGFLLGIAQVGNNGLLRGLARTYVQVFRNIPTIVYVVFIFGIMLNLPAPRQAINVGDTVYLSNRGLFVPAFSAPPSYWYLVAAILIGGVSTYVVARRRSGQPDRPAGHPRITRRIAAATVLAILLLSAAYWASGTATLSVPTLTGFNFTGGMALTIEVTTLVLAITLFGSAYIGEIVRGGLLSVPKGNIEAATALGLQPFQVFTSVQIPIAMRSIVPALSNQYLYMMKATSLGIVIGYADLFTVASLSINYSGQTLEILGIMMSAFIVINFTMSRIANFVNARLQFKTNGA